MAMSFIGKSYKQQDIDINMEGKKIEKHIHRQQRR